MDATFISLRRDTVSKEACYIACGIKEDGTKEIIAYAIAPTESATIWKEVLLDIKSRGAEDVLLFVSDGLKGIQDVIFQVYP